MLFADFPNTKFRFPEFFSSYAWHVTVYIVKAPKAQAQITASAKGIDLSQPLLKLANILTHGSIEALQRGPWLHCFNPSSLIMVHTVYVNSKCCPLIFMSNIRLAFHKS